MSYGYSDQGNSDYYGSQNRGNMGYSTGSYGPEVQFTQYNYNDNGVPQQGGYNQPVYTGSFYNPASMMDPAQSGYGANKGASGGGFGGGVSSGDGYEDEPPLLEELGINFDHIWQKTQAVLNPLKDCSQEVLCDTDLAGPLVFCLGFGGTLLLMGKLHFSYIYGLGLIGCLAMFALLSLMSPRPVSPTFTMSTLGYCMLPMVLLSTTGVFISLKSTIGFLCTGLIVFWCSAASSKLFVAALNMNHQRLLVAYPCALVYGVFALLTVF